MVPARGIGVEKLLSRGIGVSDKIFYNKDVHNYQMSTPSSESLSSRSSSLSPSPPRTPPNLHQNTIDPEAKWLVQKYGGTCVGKFGVKIAEDIVSYVVKKNAFFDIIELKASQELY